MTQAVVRLVGGDVERAKVRKRELRRNSPPTKTMLKSRSKELPEPNTRASESSQFVLLTLATTYDRLVVLQCSAVQ